MNKEPEARCLHLVAVMLKLHHFLGHVRVGVTGTVFRRVTVIVTR